MISIKKTLILLAFFICISSYSQTQTTFKSDGIVVDYLDPKHWNILENYEKGDKVEVLYYRKEGWFTVFYNKSEGYVKSHTLNINLDMEKMMFDYRDRIAKKQAKDIIENINDSINKANNITEGQKYLSRNERIRREFEQAKAKSEKRVAEIKAGIKNNSEPIDSAALIKYRSKCHYSLNEIDKFTKVKKRHTNFYAIKHIGRSSLGHLNISLRNEGGQKFAVFSLRSDLGCASSYRNNRSNVKVLLKNGKIVTFYHFGQTDCGSFELYGKLTSLDILALRKSPIESIRLTGTEYYDDIDVVDYPNFFIDKLKCID